MPARRRRARRATVARSAGALIRGRPRAPSGPSRVIRFAYRAFANDSTDAATAEVTPLVKGALRLRVPKSVRNHHSAIFKGKLLGGPVPVGGVVVDLQVWFHGQWRTFA